MAIPTDGGGSEVLKRNSIYNQSTSATQIDWAQAIQTLVANTSGTVAVPANVIITILTVFFINRSGADRWIDMKIARTGGGSEIRLLVEHSIANKECFVWNDKFVLRENDILEFDAENANVDVHLSYIYQDWS
jgi:hypothetical protein